MLDFLRKFLRRHKPSSATGDTAVHGALVETHVVPQGMRPTDEHFRLLVEGAQEYAIFLLDLEGRIVTWNAGARRIKGYTAAEIVGTHFSVFYPPEDRAVNKPARALEIAIATGKYEDEGWRLRKDGARFWASVVITALRDQAGVLRGFGKVTRDLTERKRAEDHARQLLQEEAARKAAEASALEAQWAQQEESRQRQQLQVTLASIGDAVIATDRHSRVTFLNPVAEALTGWAPHDAAGRPLDEVFQIVNEHSRRPADNPVHRVLREGLTVGLANHTVLIAKDGQEYPIDDSAAPIRGDDGSVNGVVLVFRDVTEARRAIEARLRLAAIVESSDDAIISKDLNGIITSWNHGAERLFGYTAAEIVGRPLATLAPPEVRAELPRLLERLKRGERIEHYETVRLRQDGTRLNVSLTISPLRDAEGRIVGASKIARDITASKRQEASLRFLAEASKVLAGLLDVASTLQRVASLAVPHFADWCAVDLVQPDSTLARLAVAHVDPAKVSLAHDLHQRYPPDPDAAVGVWHIVRTGKAELLSDIPETLLQASVRDPEQLALVRALGLRSYIGVPLAVRGQTIGVLTFVAAESGRRYDAADLRVAEDLAHRASIAIENARLYSELKEADQRKNEFLAMLAHELRNPLAPIRNAMHVLRMPGADAAALEQAREMTERQVQHLVRLVDDLLDVSRMMRGKIELRKQPLDLAAVIAGAVETAQPMIDMQGQQLLVTLPPEPLRLEADPTRLMQVLANLLHNAAKFSSQAGRIWLTAAAQGSAVELHVRDEGAGIRPDLLAHVFDLFVQDDRSLERSRGGLGIGLTVVRRLVELHGGTVTAHSGGPGQGSDFVIRLPGLQAMPAPAPRALLPPPTPSQARRVLVVDDNVDAAESIAMILRFAGHTVAMAHNGPDAVQTAQAFQPDAIVLDIGLPGMSGYEVARALRQQPAFATTRLIAVTGYGQDEDRRRSAAAGFDLHLTKPVDPLHLQELLAAPGG